MTKNLEADGRTRVRERESKTEPAWTHKKYNDSEEGKKVGRRTQKIYLTVAAL